jgi:hypothetical protein
MEIEGRGVGGQQERQRSTIATTHLLRPQTQRGSEVARRDGCVHSHVQRSRRHVSKRRRQGGGEDDVGTHAEPAAQRIAHRGVEQRFFWKRQYRLAQHGKDVVADADGAALCTVPADGCELQHSHRSQHSSTLVHVDDDAGRGWRRR